MFPTMNTRYFVLSLLVLCFWRNSIQAQQVSKDARESGITEIVLDLKDPKGIAPEEIAKYNAIGSGDFFRLRIENVNTYLYDVSVVNEDIYRDQELPESLLELVDFGGLKSALSNLNSVSEVVRTFVPESETSGLRPTDLENVKTPDELASYLKRTEGRYAIFYEELGRIHQDAGVLFTAAVDMQRRMSTLQIEASEAYPTEEEVASALQSFKEVKGRAETQESILQNYYQNFTAITEGLKSVISKDTDLKASVASIKNTHEGLIKANRVLSEQFSAESYSEFTAAMLAISNNLGRSYTTLPLQRYGDVNELVITLKPRDKNTKLSGYTTTLRIPDIEKSFWGVSSGFYLTDNPERNLSIVERFENGEARYDFIEEDTASPELGINAMIRYGRRFGDVLDTPAFWHLGFGAGLSIDQKFKPRLMAGGGFAFGRSNKVLIDVGAIHMYYDTLSKAYTMEGNATLPENFLVNTTKVQPYFSIGYLIGL